MIEIACLVVIGIVAWMVAGEGIWGAAHTFLCTLLAGLMAMNFFEPTAEILQRFMPADYADVSALLGLFGVLTFGIRLGSEHLAPRYIQVIPALDTGGRWVFAALTGYLTMAIFLTALHTAPLPREFFGFKPERNNFFTMAPDRQWLGFVQYISEKSLAKPLFRDKDGVVVHRFDGRYEKVGDPGKPYPNSVWPSFPIRYAQRRDRIDSGVAASSPAAQPVIQPGTTSGAPSSAGASGF
jgi:hypothetical protein